MKPPRFKSSGGFALVTVLAFIVIVTIILVAFMAKSRIASISSTNFSQSIAAEALTQDAMNTIFENLKGDMEVRSTVTSTNGISIYRPNTPVDVLATRDASATNHLIQSSSGNLSASSISTDSLSRNGRTLSIARWNEPALGGSNAPVPRWIYVNRNGVTKLSAQTADLADQTVGNTNYVIGRYAYRIYDVSGLADANVIGFPESARDAQRIGRKGSLAWLDLKGAALPGYNSNASGPLRLPEWRTPATNYANYADGTAQTNGFLLTSPGADRILNRLELLELTKDAGFSAQFSDRSAFLEATTIFSREVNAPSWAPDAAAAASPAEMNPFLPNVRVISGKEFVRRDGSPAKAGESLVKTRFPLSKLDLFARHRVASGSERTKIEAEIESYFGLRFVAAGIDGQRDFDHWLYFGDANHGTAETTFADSTKREHVLTLDQVATCAREPNFFEMLQAGILTDSLGQGMYDYFFKNRWTDQNLARHILQIGANLIDQFDVDDDPTIISRTPLQTLNAYSVGASGKPDPDICGIENLPYLQIYSQSQFRRFDKPAAFTYTESGQPISPYPLLATYFQFQLWNPHQNAAQASAGNFRIVAQGDAVPQLIWTAGGSIVTPDSSTGGLQSFSESTHWIEFSVPGTSDFASPHLLKANDTGINVSPASSSYVTSGAQIVGFWAGDINAPYNGIVSTTDIKNPSSTADFHSVVYNGSQARIMSPTGLTLQLQKKNAADQWVPIQTIPAITSSLGIVMSRNINTKSRGDSYLFHQGPNLGAYSSHPDPRTIRFGVGRDSTSGLLSDDSDQKVINPSSSEPAFPDQTHFTMGSASSLGWLPTNLGSSMLFATSGAGVARCYALGQLWKNTPSAATYHKERGLAVTRVGDSVPEAGSPNPYAVGSARPIILNRPFKSVAELGYAFRDLPWKSVNFSQDVEGSDPGKLTADAALLDLFSLTEAPLRAGVINLNAASPAVLAAILQGTDLAPIAGANAKLTAAESIAIANEIRAYLGPLNQPAHVIRTAADLTTVIQSLPSAAGWSKIKKEAIVAALADVHNARTWNLFIDLVAQTGRFPQSGRDLGDFVVTGQKRLWVHVAIDRYTGKIVDQLVEAAGD